jgi:parvulin-like peptidyl-prolyl isomerase
MRNHLWTSIAIGCAILIFASGIQAVLANSSGGQLLTGEVILLSAIACRSANKRRLKEVSNSTLRKVIEAFLILVLILLVVLQNDLAVRIEIDPAPNLIIPIICFMFYALAFYKATKIEKFEEVTEE